MKEAFESPEEQEELNIEAVRIRLAAQSQFNMSEVERLERQTGISYDVFLDSLSG